MVHFSRLVATSVPVLLALTGCTAVTSEPLLESRSDALFFGCNYTDSNGGMAFALFNSTMCDADLDLDQTGVSRVYVCTNTGWSLLRSCDPGYQCKGRFQTRCEKIPSSCYMPKPPTDAEGDDVPYKSEARNVGTPTTTDKCQAVTSASLCKARAESSSKVTVTDGALNLAATANPTEASEDSNAFSCGRNPSPTGDRSAQEHYRVEASASADSNTQTFEVMGSLSRYKVAAKIKIDTEAPFLGRGQGGSAHFSITALGHDFECTRRTAYTDACGITETVDAEVTCTTPPDVFVEETGPRFTASASVSVKGKIDSIAGAPIGKANQFVDISFVAVAPSCSEAPSFWGKDDSRCLTFPIRHVKNRVPTVDNPDTGSDAVTCGDLTAGTTTSLQDPTVGSTPTSPTNPATPLTQGTDQARVKLTFECDQICRESATNPDLCNDVVTAYTSTVPACLPQTP
jgi:hypothetical protein